VNFKPYFNADVILNANGGVFDEEMGTIEGLWAFPTASAGFLGNTCDGPFLPDDGQFLGGSEEHPDVQLGYTNADDGFNTWQTFHAAGEITVEVPNLAYDSLYLFATGAWETFLTVTFNYTTGSPDVFANIAYPSWFDPTPAGFFELIHGLDRAAIDGGYVCEDVSNPGILGRTFPVDPARVLDSFTLTRTDNDEGVLNVFGATAQLARTVYDYNLTSIFNADLVANSHGCGVGNFDQVHNGLDDGYTMPTLSTALCNPGNLPALGLPDDGIFPANAEHPRFDLAYSNADDGFNAYRRPPGLGDVDFFVDTVDAAVDEVHLIGVGGGGWTQLGVKFHYATGPSPVLVPGGVILDDWLYDGGQLGFDTYGLIDGMDRFKYEGGFFYQNTIDDAALFALPVPTDGTRVLTQIELHAYDPTGFPVPQSILGLFGIAGVKFHDSYLYMDDFETQGTTGWSAVTP